MNASFIQIWLPMKSNVATDFSVIPVRVPWTAQKEA